MKKFRLPKDFAEKWLEALESGKYKQGTGYLLDSVSRYCCLGVAGAVCNIPKENLQHKGLLYTVKEAGYHRVPDELLASNSALSSTLISLNDGNLSIKDAERKEKEFGYIFHKKDRSKYSDVLMQKYTFKEIAQFIRDNVEFY